MKYLISLLFVLSTLPAYAMDTQGLVKLESAHDVATTADRLVSALEGKGMKIFARINHGKGAASVGIEMPATELVIFGNPKIGAPLQQCARTVAIDLPQKALVWEDASGKTWLGYNDPAYLQQRHGVSGCDEVMKKMTGALSNFATAATQP